MQVIRDDLLLMIDEFGDERRTVINQIGEDLGDIDLDKSMNDVPAASEVPGIENESSHRWDRFDFILSPASFHDR